MTEESAFAAQLASE